jgi:cyclopropane-fatty-acyl-phospholipid synthase
VSAPHEDVARRLASAALRRMRTGSLTVVEGGRARRFGPGGAPSAVVHVHDAAAWVALRHGSRGLAEAYVAGHWDSPDVTAVVRVGARNMEAFDDLRRRLAPVREPFVLARSAFVRNDRSRSRRDIAAHYDLGNDLYELMLDPTMMYSCGIFDRPGMSMQEASEAKLDRVCAQLGLRPGLHVVEIGTGWGGFAIHAARTTPRRRSPASSARWRRSGSGRPASRTSSRSWTATTATSTAATTGSSRWR